MREPTLWPVLLVVIGHVVAFAAPMLLLGLRDRRVAGLGALLPLVLLTAASVAFEVRRSRRPGALSVLWLSIWLLSGAAAFVADRYGAF